jgi:superfamily I DNA/RNA helicase
MNPTPEQVAITDAAERSSASLMVTAYAGTGKTTTLTMLAQSLPGTNALALAFNVKIKKELEKRFPAHFTVMTLNGLGHRAWAKAIGKQPTPDEKKLGKLITREAKALELTLDTDEWVIVRQLVTSAMSAGLVPQRFTSYKGLVPDTLDSWRDIAESQWLIASNDLLAFARHVLTESVRMSFAGDISFDDQIYMPTLYMGQYPRFANVLVDEAQDLSPLNHLQVKKCAAGRLIVVGDPKQAIYAFRGADSESMGRLRALRDEWIDLPLTTTFRCPTAVVARQQDHAPGYNAAPSNAAGRIVEIGTREDPSWTWLDIQLLASGGTIAILCRNNAPLMKLAFQLIRRGVGPYFLGRDIGKSLVALAKKIIPDEASVGEAAEILRQWQDNEITKAMVSDHEEKVEGINDRAESIRAVMQGADGLRTGADIRRAIEALFAKENGTVTLASIHRSKGLEWDTVVHLDPWRIPSKFALAMADKGNLGPLGQEYNLKYVAETRTKHTLVLANSEDFS